MENTNQKIASIGLAGLSSFQLKIIGIVMMVFDHIHQMFYAAGVPTWFAWIGRPVLPIFLFLCAEGFFHTRIKKIYMLRLGLGYFVMRFLTYTFQTFIEVPGVELVNNIFQTIFLSTIYMYLIDMFRKNKKRRLPGKMIFSIVMMLLILLINFAILQLISAIDIVPRLLVPVLIMVPNIFTSEGGIIAVILCVWFYIFRGKRILQVLPLLLFSLLSFFQSTDPEAMQWLMALAVIPIMLYNGTKGKYGKYGKNFFYIFYPAHIYILYILSFFIIPAGPDIAMPANNVLHYEASAGAFDDSDVDAPIAVLHNSGSEEY
jgi:hypothetical protein